jgi:O-antigen/teichoic acid export membrane protein
MPAHQPRPRRPASQGARELSEEDPHPATLPGRVARNTVFSAVGESTNVLLWLLFPLAARFLEPFGFGVWTVASRFVGFFRVLPDFGMAYASTLEISRDRSVAARLTNGLLGFQGTLSVATIALCSGIGWYLFHGSAAFIPVAILSVDLVLKAIKATLRFLLKSLERFDVEALSLLAERLALLGLGTWVLVSRRSVVDFVLLFVAVRLADAAGLWAFISRRVVRLRPSRDPRLWRELMGKGLPFAYAGLVVTLIFQVDSVLLWRFRGPLEVGWYSTPTSVLEGLTLIPRILAYALIPVMASLIQTQPASVTALYRRGCKYLLLVSLPVGAFGLLESDRFIAWIFGSDYGPSVPATRILLPAVAFMFLSNFSETTLACIGRWRVIVVASTVTLALNVALNLLWIPAYGYLGSSWATLLTEAFYFVATAVAVSVRGHGPSWLRLLPQPVAAAALFSAALWLARDLPLLASAALASLAWVGATFLLRVWDPKERAALAELLRGHTPDPRSLA